MDQIRNFAQSNRSSIVNMIYLVAAFVLVYYLVMYYMDSDYQDLDLLKTKLESKNISAASKNMVYAIVKDKETKYRAKSEYTLSFWIYINGFDTTSSINQIIALFDDSNKTTTPDAYKSLLFVGLHPTQPKMYVRAGCVRSGAGGATLAEPLNTYTKTGENYVWGGSSASLNDGLETCDVMDVDLQRWMNITVSVNGRIMDVYMDGKLARSCILPNTQNFGNNEAAQYVTLMPDFRGYVSGVRWSNYAVAPDVIYARYQAGPYISTSFLDYLVDKLGIKIQYTTSAGTEESGIFGSWLK